VIRYIYRTFLKQYLPYFVREQIIDFNFNRFHIKSYSQFGEDLIIKNYFKKFESREKKYLDIGCYHPKMISNTHLLFKLGWEGTVIDTRDRKLKLFEKRRSGKVKTIKKAVVSNEEDKKSIEFYFFNQPFSGIDTTSKEFALKMRTKNNNFVAETIECIKINDLLSLDNFDFVNIDIEGMDEIVVSSIDFNKIHKPKLICFEKFNSFKDLNSKSIIKLKQNGYKHLFTSGPTVGYYLENDFDIKSNFSNL
jgi:hypothetical protein